MRLSLSIVHRNFSLPVLGPFLIAARIGRSSGDASRRCCGGAVHAVLVRGTEARRRSNSLVGHGPAAGPGHPGRSGRRINAIFVAASPNCPGRPRPRRLKPSSSRAWPHRLRQPPHHIDTPLSLSLPGAPKRGVGRTASPATVQWQAPAVPAAAVAPSTPSLSRPRPPTATTTSAPSSSRAWPQRPRRPPHHIDTHVTQRRGPVTPPPFSSWLRHTARERRSAADGGGGASWGRDGIRTPDDERARGWH